MYNRIFVLVLLSFLMSCKEEIIKKPENLIKKEVMVDIIYDLSLLEAIKFQTSKPLEKYNLTASEYIYKKYKIDSLQFAKSNMYYAADAKTYKKINEEVNARLDKNKVLFEAQLKKEKKKAVLLEKAKSKRQKVADSLSNTKKLKLN